MLLLSQHGDLSVCGPILGSRGTIPRDFLKWHAIMDLLRGTCEIKLMIFMFNVLCSLPRCTELWPWEEGLQHLEAQGSGSQWLHMYEEVSWSSASIFPVAFPSGKTFSQYITWLVSMKDQPCSLWRYCFSVSFSYLHLYPRNSIWEVQWAAFISSLCLQH